MLGDWFRTIELPMVFSDFERLPRNPAYKYEFFDGRAVLTPRPRYQRSVLDLSAHFTPRSASSGLSGVIVRPLAPDDWTSLPALLSAAFHAVPPLIALDRDLRLAVAREHVERTRTGGDGPLLELASFVSVDQHGAEGLVGAILITLIHGRDHGLEDRPHPHLTWVLAHPWHSGQGLGTALLAHGVTALGTLGWRNLTSTFLVGNERATLWHWRCGFRLV